jgi:putative CRISPR-associated protein (TIGR02619 family)
MAKPTAPRLILSPCGTSLLTNGSTEDERRLLSRHSNTKSLDEMGADRAAVEKRVAAVRARVCAANAEDARLASAELNGILMLRDEQPEAPRDYHILLCTDTWLGEQTGSIVKEWLRANGFQSVEVRRQTDLQTKNLQLFQSALSDLVHTLGSEIEGYRQQGYRVLFNLTGGFKSVQGFLQTLGNLYADETLYVFEAPGSPLLRIPRLPVKMVAPDAVRQHLRVFRRLAHGLAVAETDLADVPETFLLRIDSEVTLSPWGAVVWEEVRKEFYGEKVWPCPTDRAAFAAGFLKSTEGQPSDRLVNLNDKVDKLSVFLEGDQKHPLQSLDLKPLRNNPNPPSTHEFDAWADRDAKRVFCHYEADRLILDRLGAALHG